MAPSMGCGGGDGGHESGAAAVDRSARRAIRATPVPSVRAAASEARWSRMRERIAEGRIMITRVPHCQEELVGGA